MKIRRNRAELEIPDNGIKTENTKHVTETETYCQFFNNCCLENYEYEDVNVRLIIRLIFAYYIKRI